MKKRISIVCRTSRGEGNLHAEYGLRPTKEEGRLVIKFLKTGDYPHHTHGWAPDRDSVTAWWQRQVLLIRV
jgi:hypothetical protein